VTVTAPPRAETGRDRDLEQRVAELEALIEEARRRARRRRQRNLVGVLAAMLAGLWLYWFLGSGQAGSEPAPVVASGTPQPSASPPKAALPEELSFDANGSVVLLRRDGRRLPFLSGIFQPRGERQRHLYAGLEWSPDGSKLLALRWGYGVRALEVTDETGKVVWTVDQRYASDGRWSPDGTRIAFVHVRPEPTPASTPGDQVLFVASSDGRLRTRIAAHVREFSWSPDGTKLAYPACARRCGPSRAEGAHRLVIADATGRRAPHPVPIPKGAGAPGRTLRDVQWSPDGSLIAFVSNDEDGMHLNVVHPDGSSLRRLADWAPGLMLGSVKWSPDGSLIAFVSHDDVGMHVDVVRPDGSLLRRVADGGPFLTPWGPPGTFDWSPGGKRLAIVVPTGPRSRDVSVVNADGTDLHRIARCRCDLRGGSPSSDSVAWSLDGTRIAYISGRGNTVSTIRPDGTGTTVVATQPARGVTGYWYPSFPLWRPTRTH
jgi:dipeptidyl aminopeptidase/acylaminoacyl peptidase